MPKKERPIKPLFIIVGSVFLILGGLGSFIPIVPGSLLIVIGLACLARGSAKIYNWLLNNKLFGQRLKNIVEGKGLTSKQKWASVCIITLSAGLSAYFANPLGIKIWIVALALITIICILCQRTFKK